MFTALLRRFGSRQQRPARKPAGLSFALRLEDLEGRAAPGGLSSNEIPAIDTDHVGEEIPQTGDGIQVDPTIVPSGHGGEVYSGIGIQVGPTMT
jgi:hypothetical protein